MGSKVLPKETEKRIKKEIFARADRFGYAGRSRTENSQFMDELVEDSEIGGVLKQYFAIERVRTYIKDGVLNAYNKSLNNKILKQITASDVVKKVYNIDSSSIEKSGDLEICRAEDGTLYVVSGGTVLKWETALRKALDRIAQTNSLIVDGIPPMICLKIAIINGDFTQGDEEHLKIALGAVNVKVYFCK